MGEKSPVVKSEELKKAAFKYTPFMQALKAAAFSIRTARPADAEALVALQGLIYDEGVAFVGDGPPSSDSLRRRLRVLEPKLELYLVAENGHGTLCAWLELNRLRAGRLRHVAVLTLAVAKEARRQGLASDLLRQSYLWAERVGVKKIQLNVRAGNKAAIQLYEKEGFILEGREREQVFNGRYYEDNLIMAKFLGASDGV